MQRIAIGPHSNLASREIGFALLFADGQVYWDESSYYCFSLRQIEEHIEGPTKEFAEICLALVDRVVGDERLLERWRIPLMLGA